MKRKSLLTLFAAAAISALIFTSPAEAHRGHKHKVKKHGKARSHHVVHVKSAHRFHHHGPAFVAPRKIGRRNARAYRAYYGGEFFHGARHERISVYNFPVRTEFGIVYRPFYYRDGVLVPGNRISFNGRRVSFSIGF